MKMRLLTVLYCTSLSAILMLARCKDEVSTPASTQETTVVSESRDRNGTLDLNKTSHEREKSSQPNQTDWKLEHWSLCNRRSQSHDLGKSCGSCICTKQDGYIFVNCSNGNWNNVPQELPSNTTHLILSNNNITHIRQCDFRNLPYLIRLDLSNISLETIDSKALLDLTRLEYLDISFNQNYPMTNNTVYRWLFQDLKSLKILKMYGNTQYLMEGTYPDMAISELTSLEELWIDGMQNRTFGPGFRKLTKLKTLKFSGELLSQDNVIRYCSTEIVKGMLDNLRYVVDLDLRACYITYIDKDAFDKTENLKVLDLSRNIKLELPAINLSFHSLAKTKIEVLKLNKIYDRQYSNCGVYIGENDIKGIKNLKYLREIQLKHNWITKMHTKVPSWFPDSVEIVEVSNNEFRLGMYMLFINKLSGVKILNCSYQFFPNLLKTNIRTSYDGEAKTFSWMKKEIYFNEKSYTDSKKTRDSTQDTVNPFPHNSFTSPRNKGEVIQNNIEFEAGYQGMTGFEASLNEYMYESKDSYRYDLEVDTGPVCSTLTSHMMQYLTPELPPKLEVLDMSYSKLAHPIYAFNISVNNSLTTANLSSCLLHCWDGPVHGVKKLTYLDLGNNFCTKVRASFFDSFPNLKTLILSQNLLNIYISSDKEGRLLKKLTKLENLVLSSNLLETIPKRFLLSQERIKHLDFSKNILKSFDIKIDHMTRLKMLNLSKNGISTLEDGLRNDLSTISSKSYGPRRKPLIVDLSHNSISCTCINLDFLKWIRDNNDRFLAILTTNCIFENRTKTSFDISHVQSLNEAIGLLEKQCASYFALAASLAGLLVFILNSIIGIVIYRYRWKIRYWYYITRNQRITRKPEYQPLLSMSDSHSYRYAPVIGFYKYHAYVASPESESEFVQGILRKRLTKGESLRLCVPEIDFVPGQSSYRMISNAIHCSKMAIFVVSPDSFLDSEWEIAIRMAQEESLKRGKVCFFAIFIEKEPRINDMLSHRWIDVGNMYRDGQFIIYKDNASEEESRDFWVTCVRKIQGV